MEGVLSLETGELVCRGEKNHGILMTDSKYNNDNTGHNSFLQRVIEYLKKIGIFLNKIEKWGRGEYQY